MTILRKITVYDSPKLRLSCGHVTTTLFIGQLLGGAPKYPWVPCSTCALERHNRTTGKEGAAIWRAVGRVFKPGEAVR